MLYIGLSIVGVSVTAVLLIIRYYEQPGVRNSDPAEPPWLADSFPFYISGVVGVFLSAMAIVIMIGRKMRDLVARH